MDCPSCGKALPDPAAGCPDCDATVISGPGRSTTPAAADTDETMLAPTAGSGPPGSPAPAGPEAGADDATVLAAGGTAEVSGGTVVSPGDGSARPDRAGGHLEERYEMLGLLGEGAMGRVDRARDRRLERLVAIKRIKDEWTSEPGIVERFLREASALAKFSHPGIVQVLDVGEDAEGAYFIMEFVEGESLEARLRRHGKLSVGRSVEIVRRLLQALAVLHEKGVVHRDIKPLNIVIRKTLDGEQPVLLDFGLARTQDSGLTMKGDAMGTPQYMAPEQWIDGSTVDHRADIYSVGATLYRLVTGRTPLDFVPEEIPESLRQYVLQLLERDRRQRPESAALALSQLEAAAGSAPVETEPDTSDTPTAPTPSAVPAGPAGPGSQMSAMIAPRQVAEEACGSCANELGETFHACPACADDIGYCSQGCFDRHVEELHCAGCSNPLSNRYVYSRTLNASLGRDLRFCSTECREVLERESTCAACRAALPREFFRSPEIDAAAGGEVRLCSQRCFDELSKEVLCARCGGPLRGSFLTCSACTDAERYCGQGCFDAHAATH